MSDFADSRKDLSSSTIEIIGATCLTAPVRRILPCHNIDTPGKLLNLNFCMVITIPFGNLNKPDCLIS